MTQQTYLGYPSKVKPSFKERLENALTLGISFEEPNFQNYPIEGLIKKKLRQTKNATKYRKIRLERDKLRPKNHANNN